MFKRSLVVSVSLISLSFAAYAAEGTAPAAPPAAIPLPSTALVGNPAPAPTPAPAVSNAVTRQEIPGLVREALMNNPEIIMDAVKKLKEKQAAEEKQKT